MIDFRTRAEWSRSVVQVHGDPAHRSTTPSAVGQPLALRLWLPGWRMALPSSRIGTPAVATAECPRVLGRGDGLFKLY